jgi:S-(hydroxymethyl)glutathione dehydrogenase / alcohol dehydrogenase
MSETTLAAILAETGKPLRLMELEIPPLRPGQLLIDIAYSGLCHTQLNEIAGSRGPDRFLPHTLGHEGSGTVRAVGQGVTKAAPGDRVVLSWLKGSGAEAGGTVYKSADGPVNSGAVSTFMRRTVTGENRVTKLPAGVPLREAALLGCAVPTGAGMVLNSLLPKAGQSLAIFGLGGIGLSALIAAASLGLAPLIAVDPVPAKLALARRLGASHGIDPGGADPVAAIRALTKGGADFSIEASGNTQAMEAAFESVRPGGRCLIAGNPEAGAALRIDPYSLIAGKQIAGSWGGDSRLDRDIPRYAALYASGRLPLAELIGGEYPLADVNRALEDFAAGRVTRALLAM